MIGRILCKHFYTFRKSVAKIALRKAEQNKRQNKRQKQLLRKAVQNKRQNNRRGPRQVKQTWVPLPLFNSGNWSYDYHQYCRVLPSRGCHAHQNIWCHLAFYASTDDDACAIYDGDAFSFFSNV